MEKKPPTPEDIKGLPADKVDEAIIDGRKQKRACFRCDYWNVTESEKGQAIKGECRFNAPTILDVKWPTTDLFDWCSNFKE